MLGLTSASGHEKSPTLQRSCVSEDGGVADVGRPAIVRPVEGLGSARGSVCASRAAAVGGRVGGGAGRPIPQSVGKQAVPRRAAEMSSKKKFSDELEQWLESDGPKSLGALGEVFAEKTFAVTIMLLMLVSATPLPTGGVTLVFQIIAALVAAQMVLGRQTIWLPRRWRQRELGGVATRRAIPFIVRLIRWLEKYSRPRWAGLFHRRLFIRLVGVVLITFAIAASLAPPLSGLETLPAMGAVVVALAIILEDVVVFVIGVVIGTSGIVLFVSVSAALIRVIRRLF